MNYFSLQLAFSRLEFRKLVQCILVVLLTIMMASALENALFNIEKLDGTNFSYWKEQIYNVLVQKK